MGGKHARKQEGKKEDQREQRMHGNTVIKLILEVTEVENINT